jgi:hypothetical protein
MRRMSRRRNQPAARVLSARFAGNLCSRRIVEIELPEFLICALHARLNEANIGAEARELCSLHHLIESELINLISVRDVAVLEESIPGFTQAVQQWLAELRE